MPRSACPPRQTGLSRRRTSNAMVFVLAAGLAGSVPAAEPPPTPPAAQVLIVTGIDYPGHPWKQTAPRLAQLLEQDPRLRVTTIEDPHFLDSAALDRYDAAVLHFMNWEKPSPGPAARENLRRFVARGKGLVLVHFACGAWQDWPEFASLAGQVWDPKLRGHDPRGPFQVRILDSTHPVTRGLQDFRTEDELYTCLAGALPIHILAAARSVVDGKDYPMAFVLGYGQGRIFHSPLGHDLKAFEAPAVGELFRRGTAWAARIEPVASKTPKAASAPSASASATNSVIGPQRQGRGPGLQTPAGLIPSRAGTNAIVPSPQPAPAALKPSASPEPPAARPKAPPSETGLFRARVEAREGRWHVAGRIRQVILDPDTLRLEVRTPGHAWFTAASMPGDLLVRHSGASRPLQLSAARRREIAPYHNGFQSGLQIRLSEFGEAPALVPIELRLRVALEGPDEEVVFDLNAIETAAAVEECRWPAGFDPGCYDTTVVPFMQGMRLPKEWPKKVALYDTMSFGRGLYQPWWGHLWGNLQKEGAVLVLLETPVDAGCRFEHPAGGPTRIAPRWIHSLGRWAYPRRLRWCFFDEGDHVTLAKRYRQHAISTGRFVSLEEKIARNPAVARLLGSPVVHTSILYHIEPASSYYHKDNPALNHQGVTFAERAADLESLAQRGFPRFYVHLDGWGRRGYDNLHPDVLPPGPEAGGWHGLRQLAAACDRLGCPLALHDQYRDYYLDADSFDARHALMQQDGGRPVHSTWYGGRQTVLCPSLAPGHVRKNHRAILDHGVALRGVYLDVFSVVPPEECYHPDHPVTRADCLQHRGEALDSVRAWGGIVSSEEPSDWSIPHLDLVHHGPYALDPNPGKGPALGIPTPLFNLVYHDALLIPWSLERGAWGIPETDSGFLHGLGNAGLPYLSLHPSPLEAERVRTMTALHRRVGLLEMTDHKFIEPAGRRQQFAFADGTRVTIDLDRDSYEILPALTEAELAGR